MREVDKGQRAKRKMGIKGRCHRHKMQWEWDWGETDGGGRQSWHWLKDSDPWGSHKIPFSVHNSNFEAPKWIGSKLALGFTMAVFESA